MIGTEKVSLVPASGGVYEDIQAEIDRSPDHEFWYGPRASTKRLRVVTGNSVAADILPIFFAGLAVALLVDAFGDTDSAWNRWDATFFVGTMAALLVGFIISLVVVVSRDSSLKRHKFIVRLGDRVNIGAADIWQDTINNIRTLDCSLLEEFRGRKLGSIATRIRKCFTDLEARRIEASALSTNPACLKMNDRLIAEGVLKDRYVIRQQFVSDHLFRLLKSEWLEQLAQAHR